MALTLVGLLLVGVPAAVRANMADPVQPGDAAGEPSGALAGLVVERETLELDLRPLERGEPVRVEAVYRIRNDGAARTVELVFVAPGLAQEGEGVWLDGRRIPTSRTPAEALPAAWSPPATTPTPDGDSTMAYPAGQEGAFLFRLGIGPGRHEVRVRYPVSPAYHADADETMIWQIGYVLAPARAWGGFGGLDARVLVPSGWRVATEPMLRREGDLLTGSWDHLPADALAISAQLPPPSPLRSLPRWLAAAALDLAALIAAVWLVRRLGRALARRGRRAVWALPASFALAALWAVVVSLSILAIGSPIPEAQRPAEGYGRSILAVLLLPILGVAGGILLQKIASRAHRSAAPREEPLGARPTPHRHSGAGA